MKQKNLPMKDHSIAHLEEMSNNMQISQSQLNQYFINKYYYTKYKTKLIFAGNNEYMKKKKFQELKKEILEENKELDKEILDEKLRKKVGEP